MSLIKKIDVPRHFAARRAMALVAGRRVIQPGAAEVSALKPAAASVKAASFIRDFALQHSESSAPLLPKE
jgi:hypothetical protein